MPEVRGEVALAAGLQEEGAVPEVLEAGGGHQGHPAVPLQDARPLLAAGALPGRQRQAGRLGHRRRPRAQVPVEHRLLHAAEGQVGLREGGRPGRARRRGRGRRRLHRLEGPGEGQGHEEGPLHRRRREAQGRRAGHPRGGRLLGGRPTGPSPATTWAGPPTCAPTTGAAPPPG